MNKKMLIVMTTIMIIAAVGAVASLSKADAATAYTEKASGKSTVEPAQKGNAAQPNTHLSPIVVPKKVAVALDSLVHEGLSPAEIYQIVVTKDRHAGTLPVVQYFSSRLDELMTALVVGYTSEKDQYQRVRAYYDVLQDNARKAHKRGDHEAEAAYLSEARTVVRTLDKLDISVDGVNR